MLDGMCVCVCVYVVNLANLDVPLDMKCPDSLGVLVQPCQLGYHYKALIKAFLLVYPYSGAF